MKIRVVYHSFIFRLPLLNNYAGMVLYPFMLFKRSKEEVPDTLFRHELEHVYQVQREGWFKFYIKYLYLNVRKGYRNNPYEIEARDASVEPLTSEERKLKE